MGLAPGVLPPITTYEQFVGVWLCQADLLWQRIYTAYMGAAYAGSLGDLPLEMFLAVLDDEAAAFEAWSNTNNSRSDAQRRRGDQSGVRSERLF